MVRGGLALSFWKMQSCGVTVQVERELCDWVVKGAEVPPPSPFLPGCGENMGPVRRPRAQGEWGAQDTVPWVSRVTNGTRRKRPR